MHYYLLLISTILTITPLFSFVSAFGQLEIPNKFSTFTNEEYGIQLEYPSEWQIFGDRVPGDYVTDIAVFAPYSEVNFKEYAVTSTVMLNPGTPSAITSLLNI